jgi:alkanesulfonate monooxygenase
MTKLLWYISPVDGRFPWYPGGRYPLDHTRLRRLAQTLDRRGYYGALLGTYDHDTFTLASSLFPFTDELRFLLPVYPGVTSPALLAQQAATFDDLTGGRLIFNLVNGSDGISYAYGVRHTREERYELSAEYWELFKKIYRGEAITEPGRFFDLTPAIPRSDRDTAAVSFDKSVNGLGAVQSPNTPLWGAGASPSGQNHAGRVVDVFLSMWDRPDKLKAQIEGARAAAARHGREIKVGVHGSVIVRETEEAAWAQAQYLLDSTPPDFLRGFANGMITGRVGIEGGLDAVSSDDPQVQFRIDTLRSGVTPRARELEVSPNLWCGITPWSPLDPLGQGTGTFVVGNPQQVAERIHELEEDYDIDALILSNWPLIEESERFADLVLPLLDLDYDAPPVPGRTGNESHGIVATPREVAAFA